MPTMGALHDGHLAIVRKSKAENDLTVASIFINPTQFNNKEDYDKYPVTTGTDIEKLYSEKCDVLFLPSAGEIYPQGEASQLHFDIGYLDTLMEGAHRPGHFNGVAQVVKLLLDIVTPTTLYLGQKDYQQYKVIEKMMAALRVPTELRMCATVRESDGLAMSSRNVRLDAVSRTKATEIYRALRFAADAIGSEEISNIKSKAVEMIEDATGSTPEYFEIVDAENLLPVLNISSEKSVVICTAVWIGGVRLIDNMVVGV